MIDYGKRINNVGMFGKTGAGHLVIDDNRGFSGEGLKPYSPRNIFYGYKAGVFLDLSQPNRYQNAAGTTLATSDTDPLGLIYDLKNGVPVLGAPLTLLATTAAKTTDGTTTVNLLATSSVVGKAVRVQFTVASITGSFTVSSTGTSGTSVTVSATGAYDIVVMAGATGGNIKIEGITTSRFDVTGIAIHELPGNHAYQVTTTARPLLGGVSANAYAKYDLADDATLTYMPAISSGTVVIMTTKGAWFNDFSCAAGAFDWGPTSFTGGTASLFSALKQAANDYREIARLIINRSLTANEKSQLLAWAKSRGCPGEITFGSDIVVNGSFATNITGWENLNSAAVWDAGRAKLFNTPFTGGNPVNRFRQQIPTVSGKFYYATAQFTNTNLVTFLNLQARVYGPVGSAGTVLVQNNSLISFASGGKTSIAFEATGTDQLSILVDTTATGTLFGHVDNITCREIIFP